MARPPCSTKAIRCPPASWLPGAHSTSWFRCRPQQIYCPKPPKWYLSGGSSRIIVALPVAVAVVVVIVIVIVIVMILAAAAAAAAMCHSAVFEK